MLPFFSVVDLLLAFKKHLFRFCKLIFTRGAFSEFLKSRSFSLAAYLQVKRLLNYGIKPLTIIDVGANQGQFTLTCLRHFSQSKIYSIEPNPNVIQNLFSRINNSSRITLINKAISDAKGSQQLYCHDDHQASSLLGSGDGRNKFFKSDKINQIIDVDVDTLDALFLRKALDEPILVKIDVQGYEDRVLKGAVKLLQKIKWVVIEISFYEMYQQGVNAQSIFDIMKENGFIFIAALDFHTYPSSNEIESIVEMDALFVNGNLSS